MPSMLDDMKRKGRVRVAINTGNLALVQNDEGTLRGISPALAQRFAAELELDMETVLYNGAGKVFADAEQNLWDVAFLAIDKKRAEKVTFTRPYVTIEATYAVRATSSLSDVEDVDRHGATILTSIGSAYDLHLAKTLQHAKQERFGTPPESFEAFRTGRCDAVAGVRESLMSAFGDDPALRILPGVLTKVEQAMVLPGRNNPEIATLDAFVIRALEDGFVAAELSR